MRLAWLCLFFAVPLQAVTDFWVELGAGHLQIARAVAEDGACPPVTINRHRTPMQPRAGKPDGFPLVCEAVLPAGTRHAAISGTPLHLLPRHARKIVVFGDTGCRVKAELGGFRAQDCHGDNWPFLALAARAAKTRPAAILHVGDYLYRETPCPPAMSSLCGGPAGDNWAAWKADFFDPGRPLLQAAPWVFSRGNHEDCTRSWRGYFYLLNPEPMPAACVATIPPYVVNLAGRKLAVIDSAVASDTAIANPALLKQQIELYIEQMQWVAQENMNQCWIITHRPFWGLRVALKPPKIEGLNYVLQHAWHAAPLPGTQFILAGHTHLFELLRFADGRPPQLVAGDGGTQLAETLPAEIRDTALDGTLATGVTTHQFGYTVLRDGRDGAVKLELAGLHRTLWRSVIPARAGKR